MEEILKQIPDLLRAGKSFALCIITQTSGSVPRKAGTKMLVFDDGTTEGTLGGGPSEQQAIKDALEFLRTNTVATRSYNRSENGKPEDVIFVYFEPLRPAHKLYIFGAGHVGLELARYAAENGFNVIITDPREERSTLSMPGVSFQKQNYLEAASQIQWSPSDFIVITTYSHELDSLLLEEIADKPVAYLGMIGSKKKAAATRQQILSRKPGWENILNRAEIPVGLPIKAETPREIAISIIARLIDVKNT